MPAVETSCERRSALWRGEWSGYRIRKSDIAWFCRTNAMNGECLTDERSIFDERRVTGSALAAKDHGHAAFVPEVEPPGPIKGFATRMSSLGGCCERM